MGSCYSKKLKEYDEIISSGTETLIERIGETFDKFASTYHGQSYISTKGDTNTCQ
jgi:hypothetical protein